MDITYIGVKADGTILTRTFADRGIGYYLKNNVSKNTGNLRALLVELMNYGTMAQLHFGYNTENLLTASLDDADKKTALADYAYLTLDPKTEATIEIDEAAGDVFVFAKAVQISLTLQDKILTAFSFKLNDGFTKEDCANATGVLTYTDVHGEPKVLTFDSDTWTENGGRLVVTVSGIPAKDLRQQMTFTVYRNYGEEGQHRIWRTFIRSFPENYCNSQQSGAATLAGLCKSIIAYAEAAKTYFLDRNG